MCDFTERVSSYTTPAITAAKPLTSSPAPRVCGGEGGEEAAREEEEGGGGRHPGDEISAERARSSRRISLFDGRKETRCRTQARYVDKESSRGQVRDEGRRDSRSAVRRSGDFHVGGLA